MDPTTITFGQGINLVHAEDAVALLGNAPEPRERFRLDFAQCRHIDVGAGWRIGNALSRYGRANLIEIVVPPLEERAFSGIWFQTFTRSGLGHALAQHCRTITSESAEISEQLRRYYGLELKSESRNSVVITELTKGLTLNPNNYTAFVARFRRSLRFVNAAEEISSRSAFEDLCTLVFEAIQNVYDHAARKPMPLNNAVLSYLALRYYQDITNVPDPTRQLPNYLRNLRERFATHQQKIVGFLEITVVDDGNGIAARQRQTCEVYWAERGEEAEAIRSAIESRFTVKSTVKDTVIRGDPGYGFMKISESIRRLFGLATIRSGRHLATLDPFNTTRCGFELNNDELGYMPGTVLSVLLPIISSQLHFSFIEE